LKVAADTPDLLIIDDKPLLMGVMLIVFILIFLGAGFMIVMSGEPFGILFGLFGGGMGLVAFAVFVRRVQVVFHRSEGYVEFRRRNLFGGSRVRHALREIARAELEESRSDDGGPLWRVVLVIEEGQSVGRHPVTLAYTNGRGHQRAAEAINRWLDAARGGARREA
jgi:hypothetical protein